MCMKGHDATNVRNYQELKMSYRKGPPEVQRSRKFAHYTNTAITVKSQRLFNERCSYLSDNAINQKPGEELAKRSTGKIVRNKRKCVI